MGSPKSRLAALLTGILLLVGCSGGEVGDATETTTVDTETAPPTTGEPATIPPSSPSISNTSPNPSPDVALGDLFGWDTTVIEVGNDELIVAVADDPRERSQGLRGVDDLGDLDGMVYIFDTPRDATFIMEDTLIPIDIGFYDPGGGLVRTYEMVPCREDEDCEVYPSEAAVAYALEVPAGTFAFPPDAKLTVP